MVEVSGADGQAWHSLGSQDKVGTFCRRRAGRFSQTGHFLLRLRGSTDDSNFQVNRVIFSGASNGDAEETGKTCYLDIERPSSDLCVEAALLVPTGPNWDERSCCSLRSKRAPATWAPS